MKKTRNSSLSEELVSCLKRFLDAVDRFDTEAAQSLGTNETDLRCLVALNDSGPLTVGAVANALGLTKGATTTALDRLETKRYVKRISNQEDGRSFIVGLSEEAREKMKALWAPMRKLGGENLKTFSPGELKALIRFFQQSEELQLKCVALLENKRREPK